ncbi:unnamed protein product, partial [Clonostachys rhizophaga]
MDVPTERPNGHDSIESQYHRREDRKPDHNYLRDQRGGRFDAFQETAYLFLMTKIIWRYRSLSNFPMFGREIRF